MLNRTIFKRKLARLKQIKIQMVESNVGFGVFFCCCLGLVLAIGFAAKQLV